MTFERSAEAEGCRAGFAAPQGIEQRRLDRGAIRRRCVSDAASAIVADESTIVTRRDRDVLPTHEIGVGDREGRKLVPQLLAVLTAEAVWVANEELVDEVRAAGR